MCVHTLGRFEVRVHESTLALPSRRDARLLEALIALGPESVAEERLAHALFPALAPADARSELNVTLDQLRRWLGEPTLIAQRLGRIQLSVEHSWVDVNAFVYATRSPQHGALPLTLYQGRFLPESDDTPWIAPIRDRLHRRYLRYVAELSAASERQGAWDDAIGIFERGLLVDDLHEPFYQGLLRCHLVQGKHSEVLGTYERYKQRLSSHDMTLVPDEHTRTLIRASSGANAPNTARLRAC